MKDKIMKMENFEAPEGQLWFSQIKFMDKRSRTFLGSPNIVRLSDGTLVASHDFFGPQQCDCKGNNCGLTVIYRSEDNGRTWQDVNYIRDCFWGALFINKGSIYHLGNSREYGAIVIRRSDDGGFTWTLPVDEFSGVLFPAGPDRMMPNWQNVGPVAHIKGRFFQGIDDLVITPGAPQWRADLFQACVISAPDDGALLRADNWTLSNKLPFENSKVKDQSLVSGECCGWLESSLVEAPDGTIACMRRMSLKVPNKAAYCTVSDDGKNISFDYETGIIDLPSGSSKFKVDRDAKTGVYITLCNEVVGNYKTLRNKLILACSDDLRHWKNCRTLMQDVDVNTASGGEIEYSLMHVGFQYTDWIFDGDDILYVTRTSYDGADTFHNSNRITYNVVKDFRKYLQ